MQTREHDIVDHASPLPPPPQADAARVALFLDLDGSLLDFAEHPAAVEVTPLMRATLRRVDRALGGAFALLSGRSLEQIDAMLDVPEISAAGLHGGERREHPRAQAAHSRTVAQRNRIDALGSEARESVAALEGVEVEDKGTALALHYRRAPQSSARVAEIADALLRKAGTGFELQRGNHVVELKPAGCDKGDALAAFLREPAFAGRRPWMIGDDLTDEHAFERSNAEGGVSIIVGPRRPTAARHALADPRAVRAWLERLADSAEART